jgi:hypothetical protein
MSVVRTARLATGLRASMPGAGRTGLMGAVRAPKPRTARRDRRSGGTKDQRHKVANKRKPTH